jgi:hypothetical protein
VIRIVQNCTGLNCTEPLHYTALHCTAPLHHFTTLQVQRMVVASPHASSLLELTIDRLLVVLVLCALYA